MSERDDIFNGLVEKKADCLEFALNGFIRIYEEGEKRCECRSCESLKKYPLKTLQQCVVPL
jgi:hypothetical protein